MSDGLRISVLLSRLPTARQVQSGLRLVLLLLLAAAGALLLTDQPGLQAEYFALGPPWEGKPFNTEVGQPGLRSASDVSDALRTKVVFSIRWSGWWAARQAGEHRFSLDADDGGYLRIDDELLVDTRGVFGERRETGDKALEPGFHAVEIGLFQNYGESRLAVHWVAPGSTRESAAPLPLADLYAGRPLVLRETLRRVLPDWPRAYRQLLGAVLLLAAVLLLRGFATRFEKPAAWLRARFQALDGGGLRAALLLALFAFAFFATFPFTGTVRGGDDTSYLHAAYFNDKTWFFNRYAHVYLLKLFIALSGGDPWVGVRIWWSFVFATTVAALAVAVKSVGPGLQLRTLAVTLFVLLAQATVFGLVGAGFADFSAMMFVTVAVATYLHGLAFARGRPPPRHEWHALALGALTVGAFRSKEVGAVLLLLPLLFLIREGHVDRRSLARKTAYWMAGGFGMLLALMLMDGLILGDVLFTFDGGRLAQSEKLNFPAGLAPRNASASWLDTIWNPRGHEADVALRNLWLGVSAAAVAAGLRRRRLELRLLHLLPIAYLVALIALYVRMPHPFSPRMLIPILPVACLMTGLLLHHAGLDEVAWRQVLKPGVLVPGALAAAVLILVVIPYRLGTLEAASLLPVTLLHRYGWEGDHFVVGVLLPAVVLIVLSGLALVAGRRRARVAALLVAYLAFFGVGFEITRVSLAKKWARQTGALLLYPWQTFRNELNATPWRTIALSRDLQHYFHMSAVTRSALGHLVLGRSDFHVVSVRSVPTGADMAIASRYAYDTWRRQMPALAATATFGPGGFLVLVRPKEAAEQAAHPRQQQSTDGLPPEHREMSIMERLAELRLHRDPEARSDLLQAILDRLQGPDLRDHLGRPLGLQALQSDRLRAVGLSRDGWTYGVRPAGLIVMNPDERPWAQELTLSVGAAQPEYPIQVFLDDGDLVETVRFDQPANRKIQLRPVPERSSRLIIVWSDKAWSPRNKNDQRELGVRIRAAVQQ